MSNDYNPNAFDGPPCLLDALRKAKEALESVCNASQETGMSFETQCFFSVKVAQDALKTLARALETVHTKDDALNPKDSV